MQQKIIFVSLFLAFLLVTTGVIYGFNTIEMVTASEPDTANLNVNNNLNIDTVNIAVFGIDGRSDIEGDRSDTIMIVSLDFKDGSIKVTSVMRDLLVQIPATKNTNQTFDKINASYAYGGPELTVKTLNQNFDLNITDYVVVNFDAMVDTVDTLGGVEINVKNQDVLDWTNKYIDDVNDKVGRKDPYLTAIGPQTVTGVQALAYARNRYSDNDYERTQRQREVVGQIAEKAFKVDALTGVKLLTKVYPYVKTTLAINEITIYAKAYLASADKQFLEFRIPTDQFVQDDMINNISYVVPTSLADNAIALHAFIYGSLQTLPTDGTTSATDNSSSMTTAINSKSSTSTSSSGDSNSTSGSAYVTYVPTEGLLKISDAISYYVGY